MLAAKVDRQKTHQTVNSWDYRQQPRTSHGSVSYGTCWPGPGAAPTEEESSTSSEKNHTTSTDWLRLSTSTIGLRSITSENLERNRLVASAGERYGKLYFLSPEMEAHLHIFDEIWRQIHPKDEPAEVKK